MGNTKDNEYELREFLLDADSNAGTDDTPLPMPSNRDDKDWRRSLRLRLQILTSFSLFIVAGLCDQTVGTLLPYLVTHYRTSQTVVSIVFMLQFLGYSSSALSNEKLHWHCGRFGVMTIATLLLAMSFLIISITEYLPLYIGLHLFYGMGMGLLDSCVNVFLSDLVDHNELMGLLHGFYGVGSVISPPLVSWILKHWGYRLHYALLATLSFIGLLAVVVLFRDETKDKYRAHSTEGDDTKGEVSLWDIFKSPIVPITCAYLFLYIGAELGVGSWLLTYLRTIKSMEQQEAAFVVSWFWIGLTCGRMLLGFVTKRFGNEYTANLGYSLLSLFFFTTFAVYSMAYTGDHYTLIVKPLVFMSGVFVGPLFPTSNITLLKTLPTQLQVSGVGLATSLGGTGSAVLPFTIGAISRITGFEYLLIYIDLIIAGYCAIWMLVPIYVPTVQRKWRAAS
ncbi:MFS transporter [Cyberlindnera jadinii NRRL Y-1542]|uniref:MFS general substrate transporter n=1 Tax=Cyberlindnera jadinii (strain ATCC 18201 / CBS 1600 / BCRC 20928 / JCM 3617 / NBRC 0987 / NRRL Y-1542) TaxID=983966 RepID=A0A1E4S3P5_CYBJN|nr:MFS general substrate transporter [Cyberlindnera jadinii NRRL Y-1542]ODV74146.1 MFS general substrate transporter [Cyberlindnera jadinii NRRL Y-1542]